MPGVHALQCSWGSAHVPTPGSAHAPIRGRVHAPSRPPDRRGSISPLRRADDASTADARATVGELLARAFDLYRRNLRLVLTLTLPVVVIVIGVTALGLGELGAQLPRVAADRATSTSRPRASELVTVPLITSMLARWVAGRASAASASRRPTCWPARSRRSRRCCWWCSSGCVVVRRRLPGADLARASTRFVSWYFVVQAVVIDGDRGLRADLAQRRARARQLVAQRRRRARVRDPERGRRRR